MPNNMAYRLDIPVEEYKEYLATLDTYAFMQEPEWADVKQLKNVLIGIYRNDKIVGACSALVKRLISKYSIVYISRGPLFDYEDMEIMKTFRDAAKALAKRENAICVRIDPNVIDESRANGNMSNFGNKYEDTIKNFEKIGFKHAGYDQKIGAYWQPILNMSIRLFDENGELFEEEAFLKQLPKRQKLLFNNGYHAKRGVTFEVKKGPHDLTEFAYMMDSTAERKSITLRNKEYFERIAEAFGERAVFHYVMLDPDKYCDYYIGSLERGANADDVAHKVEYAKQKKAEKGDKICIGASLTIIPAPTQKHKEAEYVYAGTDATFRDVNPSRGTVYEGCLYSLREGCMYFNLCGCNPDPNDPLHKYKESFKPDEVIYVGEFDMVTKGLLYFGYTKVFPKIRRRH